MRSFLTLLREKQIISAAICILAGLIFILFPNWAVSTTGVLIGLALAAYGIVLFVNGLTTGVVSILTFGVLLIVCGVIAAFLTESVFALLLSLAGLFLVVRGVVYAQRAFGMRAAGYRKWWLHLAAAILILIIGVLVMVDPFGTKTVLVMLLGACLIFNGIEGLVMRHLIKRADEKRKREGKDGRIYVDSEDVEKP